MEIMNKHLNNSLKTETSQLKTITAKLHPYTTSSMLINAQQYQVGFKHQYALFNSVHETVSMQQTKA